jgi:1,4-alpha-glucan branching enzyme
MKGYFSLVLHAHLPFVRHPEHERFLEENWLFEAITESYIPLLQLLENWRKDKLKARLTLTLTPTLCSMLMDPLLQERYERHLNDLIELAGKELLRTQWEKPFHTLARFYCARLEETRKSYLARDGDLVTAFRESQQLGQLEIVTSAATHALLPLLASHPPSLRAQILVARDHYHECFGCNPRGIWLPECAYVEELDVVLQEAGLRWFIIDTHGILNAQPQPRYAVFAPILTRNGLAVFGRDADSARQVWSRDEGYPGDPRYREFYRDIGFDLDLDYIKPHLAAPGQRGFTGIKYHRITSRSGEKQPYEREQAVRKADEHAGHFLAARVAQIKKLTGVLDRPPLVVSPFDAELFGHWWYEGPEFLDFFVRKACFDQDVFGLITPEDYLRANPANQISTPAASSWGEEGYWWVWLNEKNEWIYPHLDIAQQRMAEVAKRFSAPDALQARALKQAGRELLLAQASDWPFILRTGSSPDYATKRVKDHLLRFIELCEQLTAGRIDGNFVARLEALDNVFPDLDYRYWLER